MTFSSKRSDQSHLRNTPPILIMPPANYYPYTCTEQTTSSAHGVIIPPALFMLSTNHQLCSCYQGTPSCVHVINRPPALLLLSQHQQSCVYTLHTTCTHSASALLRASTTTNHTSSVSYRALVLCSANPCLDYSIGSYTIKRHTRPESNIFRLFASIGSQSISM